MLSSAIFSPCRRYRYVLQRLWNGNKPYLTVIGLNPSTADEQTDDRTVRRCIRFATAWGCGGLYMVNLFAFKATKRSDMLIHLEPVGPANDAWIYSATRDAGIVLAAWGADGTHRGRDLEVRQLIAPTVQLYCLKLTKDGQPWHPLYVKGDTVPILYNPG